MGKKLRQTNVSGLSRFLDAFVEGSVSNTTTLANTGTPPLAVAGPSTPFPAKSKPVDSEQQPPLKKRKTGLLGPGNEAYDATGLVPFYTDAAQVPSHLQKYFAQRTRYFSRYDEGCLLDEEGWYSVTPEAIATQIAERCRCDVVLDAFCGVGGNAIAFARTCERVIALDTSPTRLALARHNAALHGLSARIEFVLADFRSFAARILNPTPSSSLARKIDVVFLSPPWGGPEYLSGPEYHLARTQPEPASELFRLARLLTPNVAFYVPRNTVLADIAALLPAPGDGGVGADSLEQVEVEEEWMGNKLKALTCYFGGLAQGQEHLF
ncbi:RNA cap guanine-N2 methyltransferase-domain-containing protein [Lactarius quietus]|nr:RNA cap guanine-N2 methyltransferase-domain-containing protein [Lactarius quietus]